MVIYNIILISSCLSVWDLRSSSLILLRRILVLGPRFLSSRLLFLYKYCLNSLFYYSTPFLSYSLPRDFFLFPLLTGTGTGSVDGFPIFVCNWIRLFVYHNHNYLIYFLMLLRICICYSLYLVARHSQLTTIQQY